MVPRSGERDRDGIRFHRPKIYGPQDRWVFDGIPCTTVARTLVDLGAVLKLHQLERAVEQAELLKVLDVRAIADVLGADLPPARRAQPASLPRRRAPRRVAGAERPRAPLPAALCVDAGLPRPTLQHPIELRARHVAQGRLRLARRSDSPSRSTAARSTPHAPPRAAIAASTARSAPPAGASSASWRTTSSTRPRSSSPPSAPSSRRRGTTEPRLTRFSRPSTLTGRDGARGGTGARGCRGASSNTVQAMRSPRDFFKPLAVGAPDPVTEIPFPPSRMIHFFDASNEKMVAKLPDTIAEGRHRARQPRGRGAGRPQGGRARGPGQGRQDHRQGRHAAVDARQLAGVAVGPRRPDDARHRDRRRARRDHGPQGRGPVGHPLRRPPARPAGGQGQRRSARSSSTRCWRPPRASRTSRRSPPPRRACRA